MKLLPLDLHHVSNRPTLLYLPGMDGTGRLFYRQQVELAPLFNLYSIALPPQPLAEDWPGLAQQVIQMLDSHPHIQPPIVLCGESFGGCLAIAIASEFPQWVKKLLLVNPATAFARHPWLHWGIPLNRWLPSPLQPLTTLSALPFLASVGRLTAVARRQLLAAMRLLPPNVVAQRLALLQDFWNHGLIQSPLTCPTLILASRRDRIMPSVEEAFHLQKHHFAAAKVRVLPNSGHACLLETELSLCNIMQKSGFQEPSLVN